MVGLSDIPCVGKAVGRISEATVEAVFRGLYYMLCYNSILNNLTSQIENVKVQEGRVSRKADAESADGKTIQDHVIKWQKEVQEIKTRADKLSKQRTSWNPLTRFRLGRKAAHEAQNVAELTAYGEKLLANGIAFLPADPNVPLSNTTYQKFRSREEAYGKLWESLVKEDGHPIIGIYGMPGVGKTRMMEQAWEEVKDKKIFDKVIRANVGAENIDVINLQNQLAGFLDCHLKSEDNEVLRASQLKRSLINAGKTLIVLDDVWDQIPLKNIGISPGDGIYKSCKILLTSRRKDVCLRNDCKDPINIRILTVDEAWDMFENTVSTSKIESLQDNSLAKKVCEECGALPLLIHAVGNALKFETKDSWRHALFQLENCNFDEIDGIESKAYTCIKLSFDKLKKDAKTCVLFCSLFREDAEIEIKILVDLATGSQLLSRGGNVRGLLDNLKSSSLLLEGKTWRTVKMHDTIRDVARSVAARDQQYAFLFIRGDRSLPDVDDYSTRKLLQYVENDNPGCPPGLTCPKLHTLWLECNNKPQQFSNSFFKGIDNLKNLVLKGMNVYLEELFVQNFDKLSVLILEGCDLHETWLSFVPENLETLRILKCYLPDLVDMSKLKSLRKLELVSDREFKISTLPTTLVELHIPKGFTIYDAEGKRFVPNSWELNKLTALTSLDIRSESCPNENVVANLRDFVLEVGNGWNSIDSFRRSISPDLYTRSVSFMKTCIEGGGKVLLESAQKVKLRSVRGSANVFSNREAFSTLKMLHIASCEEMEHLVEWKAQNEIQQSQPLSSFSNLTKLEINRCSGLKYLFSASVAECLVQLEKLSIQKCPSLEVVVIRSESMIINFPKLKHLDLVDLKSLRRFYGEKRSSTTLTIIENAATARSDCLFDEMVVFPSIERLSIEHLNTSEIWGNNNSFGELKCLFIRGCNSLKFAIPLTMLPRLQNLDELSIWDCASVTTEVKSSNNSELPPLVALRSIVLNQLPLLIKTGLNSRSRNLYPNLETLKISRCRSLRYVFPPSVAKHLVRLRILLLDNCAMMSEIIGEEEKEVERIHEFIFPEMTKVKLDSLPSLKSFCFTEPPQHQSQLASKVSFPKLAILEVNLKIIIFHEMEIGRNDSTSEIKTLVIMSDNKLQLPSTWKLQFPNIQDLTLRNCWWHGNFCIFDNRCIASAGGEVIVDRAEEVMLEDVKGSPNAFSKSNTEAFPNMTKLSIQSCGGMEHLACIPHYEIQQSQPLTSFTKLAELRVYDCCGLKYLFSASVAKCLVELERLSIANCPALEVVVRNDSTIHGLVIQFPKLNDLFLANLQSLRSFRGENRGGSSSSTTIMENTDALTAGSETLFDGMVTFPTLERLWIHYLKTSAIWERNCYSNDSFCQLKDLDIKGCHNLEFAIPLAMSGMFQNLEELDIRECESMSSEVESSSSDECSNIELPLVALRSIHLYKMPVLTQTRLNSRRRNLYPNLETLSISECNSLRNVFLPSTAKHLERSLKKLTVESCKMMTELIGKQQEEERNDKFVFLELTELQLCFLPNFKSLCFGDSVEYTFPRQHQFSSTPKVSFPKLVELMIDVKTIILEEMELGRNDSTSEITKLVVKCDTEVQLPSKWQLQLPNVELLELKNCLWHGSSAEHNVGQFLINCYGTLSFHSLRKVDVNRCGVSVLFPCSVFRNLHQLETLKVTGCPLLEEVVKEEDNIVGTSENTISLLQLRSIYLHNLPKLKSFSGSTVYAFNMPVFSSISVWKCPQMENFTCLELRAPLMPDFNTQIQAYLSNPNRDNKKRMLFTR